MELIRLAIQNLEPVFMFALLDSVSFRENTCCQNHENVDSTYCASPRFVMLSSDCKRRLVLDVVCQMS